MQIIGVLGQPQLSLKLITPFKPTKFPINNDNEYVTTVHISYKTAKSVHTLI